jgi:hypothetical protein
MGADISHRPPGRVFLRDAVRVPHTRIMSCSRRSALAAVLAAMITSLVTPAAAQLSPQQPQRVQIAGTRITLIPALGLTSPPGAPMLVRQKDGLGVIVQDQKAGTLETFVKGLASPDFQRTNQASDVEVSLRPQGAVKRAFIKMFVTEKVGVQHRRMGFIDDGKSAAMVIANVSKKAFDADPSLAGVMDQMLETVSFTDKVLALRYAFKMVPPPGYRPVGSANGQMQHFGAAEREFIIAVRLERPIAPADIARMADFVIPRALDRSFDQLETLSESRARCGEWEYCGREFKGVSKQFGAAAEGLVRQQTNTANESYLVIGYALPPLSDGMKA